MREITDAVVLMAGTGSRLRASGEMLPKPLVPIFGRPLISYIMEALQKVGVRQPARRGRGERRLARRGVAPARSVGDAPESDSESRLAKAKRHLRSLRGRDGERLRFSSRWVIIFSILPCWSGSRSRRDPGELNLAIDRKISAIFDLDDAMKVQTTGDRVSAIGKTLATYDAIDTGVFLCPNELFDYLRRARRRWRLQPGRRRPAHGRRRGRCARSISAQAWWQDVDTFAMRKRAEEELAEQTQTGRTVGALVATGRSWARQLSSWLEERAQPRVQVSLQDLWV